MDPSSEIHLIKTVEKQLISEHLNNILTKGLDALLEEDRKPELKLMYSLVGKFGSNRSLWKQPNQSTPIYVVIF